MQPYSVRTRDIRDVFRYDLPENVRNRVYQAVYQRFNPVWGGRTNPILGSVWSQFETGLQNQLLLQYGMLTTHGGSGNPLKEHLDHCDTSQFLDAVEFFFQVQGSYTLCNNDIVKTINTIFQQEAIGYELTEFVRVAEPKKKKGGKVAVEIVGERFPQIIQKSDEFTHQHIVQPALKVLSAPKFKVANDEILAAYKAFRENDLRKALSECEAAYESVFKTICTEKGWRYDPARATLKDLVQVCKDNGLFFDFYTEVFKNAAMARNKLGAHGQGPTPHYTATTEHVEHALQTTAAHIIFLTKLAGV